MKKTTIHSLRRKPCRKHLRHASWRESKCSGLNAKTVAVFSFLLTKLVEIYTSCRHFRLLACAQTVLHNLTNTNRLKETWRNFKNVSQYIVDM